MDTALKYLGWIMIALICAFVIVVVAAMLGSEWAHNIMLAFDQYWNAVFAGDPDETISSRLGKWQTGADMVRRAIADIICPILGLLDPNHCATSIDMTTGGKAVIR